MSTDSDMSHHQPDRGEESPSVSRVSPVMIVFMTALDTTWRAFVPTLGGVFLGIALDHWLNVTPVATIICLALGTALSIVLIVKQLRDVRKPLK